MVAVNGRLEYHEWHTDAGERRHDYEVIGNVEFLTAPRANGAGVSSEPEAVTS